MYKIKIFTFISLFLLLFPNILKSQSTPITNIGKIRILPPSIENYQFTKYGNLTLRNNNGGFSYSIPIYKIAFGPLNLPLSLDYFTTGVKINDLAGIAGMGWNLNAGGMITRVIKGEPDEKANVMDFRISKAQMFTTISGDYTLNEYTTLHRQRLKNIYNSVQKNYNSLINHEQDWFNFNFNNISGSFYIHNGELYINSKQSDIKGKLIKTFVAGQAVLEFQFTLSNGVKYTFGGGNAYSEYSEISSNCQKNYEKAFPTTWYLKNIHYNGWNINFTYEESLKRYPYSYYEKYTLIKPPPNNPSNYISSSNQCISLFESINAKYLKEIEFGNSKIEFNYLNDRADYYSGKILHSIKIKNKNITKKKIELSYNFSTNSAYTSVVDADVVKHRAFLETVTINDKKDFLFEYNNIDGLPPRLSYKQDLYGYANSNNYPRLINVDHPAFHDTYSDQFREWFTGLGEANRNVDENKSLYGVLTKITYPTKGHTEIQYENNTTFGIKSTSISDTKSLIVEDVSCGNSNYPKEAIFQFIGNGSRMYITAGASVELCKNTEDYHDIHTLSITDLTASRVLFSGNVDPDRDFIGDGSLSPPLNHSHEFYPISTIDGHQYEIKYSVNSMVNNISGKFSIRYNLEDSHIYAETNYSGARVKSIKDFTNNNLSNSKIFVYNTKDSLNAQSTSLIHKYFFDPWKYTTVILPDWVTYRVVAFNPNSCTLTSKNQIASLNSRFNRINYEAISVVSENGLIERTYNVNPITSFGTDIIINSVANVTKSNYSEWNNNQLKQITFFKKNGNNLFEKVKRKRFFYTLLTTKSFDNYNFIAGIIPLWNIVRVEDDVIFNNISPWGCTTLFCNVKGKIGIHYYKNFVYHSELTKEERTEYFDNGNQLTTTINYEFSSTPIHFQPTEIEYSTSNNNKKILKRLYYPEDFNMTALINANRIAKPIQTQTYKKVGMNETLLSTEKTTYANFNGLILPSKTQTAKGSNTLENRVTYDRYDTYGNILQVSKEDGPKISYIWGYDHQYPVAKVEKASYADIEQVLGVGFDLGGSRLTPTQEDQLRHGLPKSQVTTYTYEPLVGVRSITDPKGQTITYHYDAFNRLEFVKDEAGNILKEHKYHYKELPNP